MGYMERLAELREQIDSLDHELLQLLAKRKQVVHKVGEVKQQHGLPIYAPQREAAEQMGLSPNLIEDVLRRIMRESYVSENQFGFKTVNPQIRKIVIVGGRGKLGSLFCRYLQGSDYQVKCLERDGWARAEQILQHADVVIVSVPIANTLAVIEQLKPYLTENMLLVDFTSVKRTPLEKMLEVHQGAVVGLHPMFGPDVVSMAKQVVVCCDGRFSERYQWLLQQIQIWGAKIYQVDAAEHDHHMTYIQALRHFSTFVYGLYLSQQPVDLEKLLALSSPIYRLELAMVGRLFAQDAALYADIIAHKPENLAVIEHFKDSYETGLAFFKHHDRQGFIEQFNQIRDWFGGYSEQFLQESRQLLQQANDSRNV
ncbi:chorismate mutase [Aggregatibacter actinomycetemcomitans NUM4039]|nr:chorismate mutase [Aggregatibacter actinomycetemcomitans NUM4039]